MKAVADELLTLRGPPNAVEGLVPGLRWSDAISVPELELDAPGAEEAVAAFITVPDSASIVGLRVVLADDTPPGSYGGALRLARREFRVAAEVTTDAALALLPGTVRLEAAPAAEASASVVAINTGNVPVDMPERQDVGLFAAKGLDRALGQAFSGEGHAGLQRFDALGEALAAEHGGIVAVVAHGAGELPPGERREVTLTVAAPKALRPGTLYFGFWRAGGTRLQLKITVQASQEVPA